MKTVLPVSSKTGLVPISPKGYELTGLGGVSLA